jgi:hypothetical protein
VLREIGCSCARASLFIRFMLGRKAWRRFSMSGIDVGIGVPPRYRIVHNLPNKPLSVWRILQNPENKRDSLQNLQNTGVMASLELFGRHKPGAGGFCL